MQLDERISYLERKINEQNDAIKEIALYMLEILDENDKLWKHLMKNISERKERDIFSTKFNDSNKFGFRSRTPPPLEEPGKFSKEVTNYCGYRRVERDSELEKSYLRLLREQRQNKNEIERFSGNKMFKNNCTSRNYDRKL